MVMADKRLSFETVFLRILEGNWPQTDREIRFSVGDLAKNVIATANNLHSKKKVIETGHNPYSEKKVWTVWQPMIPPHCSQGRNQVLMLEPRLAKEPMTKRRYKNETIEEVNEKVGTKRNSHRFKTKEKHNITDDGHCYDDTLVIMICFYCFVCDS